MRKKKIFKTKKENAKIIVINRLIDATIFGTKSNETIPAINPIATQIKKYEFSNLVFILYANNLPTKLELNSNFPQSKFIYHKP